MGSYPEFDEFGIAIIGMASRFPRAKDLDEFWNNLVSGIDCVSRFRPEELRASGVSDELITNSAYAPARAVLDGIDQFDASFFSITPRDAEVMDPQHRFLLECAWEALEDGGYASERSGKSVGLFAGASSNSYVVNAWSAGRLQEGIAAAIATDRDHLTTRVAYKLDLRGPAITVQSSCSTSLLAVHLAR